MFAIPWNQLQSYWQANLGWDRIPPTLLGRWRLFQHSYPLVNVYITKWKITIFHGKIHYKWWFSIVMWVITRGYQLFGIAIFQTMTHAIFAGQLPCEAPGNVFEDRLYHSMMSRGPRAFSRHATFNHHLITDMNRKHDNLMVWNDSPVDYC